MEVMGPIAYSPETFGTAVLAGIVLGWALSRGHNESEAKAMGRALGRLCRNSPGMTFGKALDTIRVKPTGR